MAIRYGSVHQKILTRICVMPKAVRGMSAEMLLREFGDTGALDDLAASGLLKKRGWMDGPGTIWIPTAKGEALHQTMIEAPCLST
ncbi:MAG: hypothetical protein ACR2Q4_07315, partial [Geminicoccaceae bacterium]